MRGKGSSRVRAKRFQCPHLIRLTSGNSSGGKGRKNRKSQNGRPNTSDDGYQRTADKTGNNEVYDNEIADQVAKAATKEEAEAPQITEGGLKQAWKKKREKERRDGSGDGKVIKWNRKARVMYVQCRTGKGNLQAWRHKIGQADDPECRKCGRNAETGKHDFGFAYAVLLGEGQERGVAVEGRTFM